MKRLILGACLLAATACQQKSPADPTTPIDRQVVLAPGTQVALDGTPFSVRFDSVTGDSRCPADAVCVTGGDAVVKVAVRSGGNQFSFYDLHTGDMKPVIHGGALTIALVELAPYPFSARPIDPNDYRATLRITR
jgi:hypothetical protein